MNTKDTTPKGSSKNVPSSDSTCAKLRETTNGEITFKNLF